MGKLSRGIFMIVLHKSMANSVYYKTLVLYMIS